MWLSHLRLSLEISMLHLNLTRMRMEVQRCTKTSTMRMSLHRPQACLHQGLTLLTIYRESACCLRLTQSLVLTQLTCHIAQT